MEQSNITVMEFEPSGLLIGVTLFSFESISMIVNSNSHLIFVRRTSKSPRNVRRLTRITLISAAVFFIIFAISFQIVDEE